MPREAKAKKTTRFKSLTVALSAIFLLLTLAVLLITSGLETYLSFKIQQKAIASQEELIAQGAANTVRSFIKEKTSLLETVAKLGYVTPLSQTEPSMNKLLSLEPAFRQLVLLDSQQQEVLRVSRVSKTESDQAMEFNKSEAFSKLNEKEVYISPVYIQKVTNEPMMAIAVPVKNVFGDVEGVLVADVKLKFMWDLVDQLKVGTRGLTYVVDRQGNLIAFGDVSRVLKEENLASLEKVSEFIRGDKIGGKSLIAFSRGILGTNVVSDYAPLGTPDWAAVVELPVTEAYAGVINQLWLTILIIILIIALGAGFGIYLSRIITKPIITLRNAAEEISRGKLETKVEIKSRDEIGELAESFNFMTQKLLISREKIEEKVKELSAEHGKIFSLVESVRLGVVMVDLSLNVILANSAAKKILGKSPLENLTFKNLSEKLKGNIDISQALSFYVKSGKSLNIQEAMIDSRYFRFFMSPVRDIIDKIFIGAVVIIEDITEEKRLEKMRTEIVSITSHQLRTPSTIIKGNLEMLLDGDIGKISKMQKEVLTDVYLGNERMIRLINDLMDASKIEEGKFKLITESAKLEDLTAEIIKELLPLADEKKVALIYDRSTEVLPEIKINIQRVKQVLQNLIVNSVLYSAVDDKGRVEVTVKKEGKFLKFSVKDNGIGIPKDEQDKLFERFFRGSNVTKLDPGGGSGLGLYIARAVIEQGGGKITFVSQENKGTTFNATFPY
ncbi:MAG: ATP-binding protein [Patescibacteria group bacterium]|jgi:signal transduction histidine kinase